MTFTYKPYSGIMPTKKEIGHFGVFGSWARTMTTLGITGGAMLMVEDLPKGAGGAGFAPAAAVLTNMAVGNYTVAPIVNMLPDLGDFQEGGIIFAESLVAAAFGGAFGALSEGESALKSALLSAAIYAGARVAGDAVEYGAYEVEELTGL